MTVPHSVAPVSVSARFWLGSVVPSLGLGVVVALLLTTGAGKREAPTIVFFASLIAVPALVLLNGWVLFVEWRRRSRLIASASVLPAVVALGCLLFVHGSGRWQELGMLPLVPFLMVPMRGLSMLAAAWALALVVLVVAARRMATKGRRVPRR